MGVQSNEKEYYESENERRVLYIMNLSLFLTKLHDQVLKLPHEIMDADHNYPSGCTEKDIVSSVMRGVDLAYVMVAPARAMLSNEKGKLVNFAPLDEEAYKAMSDFDKAMEKLQWIYLLLEEADWLTDRLMSDSLPDDETYDYGGKLDEATNEPVMPTPVATPNDKTMGAVEKENK